MTADNEKINDLTGRVIGAAIEVHKKLGPGLLESVYEACLAYELAQRQIAFKKQHDLPVKYKEVNIDCGYRLDLLVEDALIVKLKAVEKILPIHGAQILTYMRLAGCRYGLLINFNSVLLKDGIQRFVQD